MKKFFVNLSFLTGMILFIPAVQSTASAVSRDTLFYHVMQSILDTNRSCLDIKDELISFFDSTLLLVQTNPDENKRKEAKSFALEVFSIFKSENFFSPEETQFIETSLLKTLEDIQYSWYVNSQKGNLNDPQPLLSQTIIFRDEEIYDNNVIYLHLFPSQDGSGEELMVILPKEAETLASILFYNQDSVIVDSVKFVNESTNRYEDVDMVNKEQEIETSVSTFVSDNIGDTTIVANISKNDTLIFSKEQALSVRDKSRGVGEILIFGQSVVEAMLSHSVMLITYFSSESALLDEEVAKEDGEYVGRLRGCSHHLTNFQTQYHIFVK